MKICTNVLDADAIRTCLDRAKTEADMPADVVFDVFAEGLSARSYRAAFEVHLASADRDNRADSETRKSNPMSGSTGVRYAASYDEWGYFLAQLFAADPDAKAAPYKNKTDFHAKTKGSYALVIGDLPATRETVRCTPRAEAEPFRGSTDTAPTSDAHACTRHCGTAYHPDSLTVQLIERHEREHGFVAEIGDVLAGCWRPNHP